MEHSMLDYVTTPNETMSQIVESINSVTEVSTATSTSGSDPAVSMNSFYPALVQCFGIIICGYIAGRFKIISNAETKGLATFVGTFALPSLIFLSLVELDWNTVNWTFLLAMFISKAVVFFAVLIVALMITRPLNYGRAGLLGIFCTQSNDFAIGYPIVRALYKDVHPEYASYLYLMAPISLALLNPIGLVLMEISKVIRNRMETSSPTCPPTCSKGYQVEEQLKRGRCLNENCAAVLNTVRSLFFNPLLLMTLLGVAGAFLFPNGLPEIIASVLRVFGSSFSATALFLLGLKIVGQGSTLRGSGFLLPGILILVKILVLPLICRQTVNIMQPGINFNDTTELSTFGFLYGTFPAAPGAFVIATQYNIEVELIAKSMVLCTFISAPLMFISAKMISLTTLNPNDYLHELDVFSFDISVAGVSACIWMLLLLGVTKRYQRMPHRITACLIMSQLMCCIGVIMWSQLDHGDHWLLYVQFLMFNIGTYSSRLWTAILAITLLFLQCRSLCFVLKLWPYMIVFAWGIPALISALLLAFDVDVMSGEKQDPSFQYGNAQAAISVFIFVMCFIVTIGCLVLHQRCQKRYAKYLNYARELSNPESEQTDLQSTVSTTNLLSTSDAISRAASGTMRARGRNSSYSTSSSDDDEVHSSANENCCITSAGQNASAAIVVDIEDMLQHRGSSSTMTKSTDAITIQPDNNNKCEQRDGRSNYCGSSLDCDAGSSRQACQNMSERYDDEHNRNDLEPLEFTTDTDEHQTLKHTVLLIILLCSMFVGLAVSIWTLVMEGMSGIYLELSFLDVFLNFGQSLIVLAVFITDTGELLLPLVKLWRKLWYGANILTLPHWTSLSAQTKHICEQFRNHHLDNCRKDIARDRRWRIKVYRKVFYGSDFVDWLIDVGLAKDRLEAVHYAKSLVDGRVLRHINNVYHFDDKKLLYSFCNRI